MNNFFNLLKVNIYETFKLNNLLKRNKEGKKAIKLGLLIAVMAIAFFGLMCFEMYVYAQIFYEAGFPQMILIVGIILGTALTLIANISQIEGYLYKSRDFDLLMSLPLSKKEIVSSKIVSLVLINYASLFIILIPAVIGYVCFTKTTLMFWISVIVGFFLLSLLPIVISGIIFYLFGFMKINPRVKQMIVLIISICFFIVIMIGSMSINSLINIGESTSQIVETVKKIYYPGYLLYNAAQGNVIDLLLFAVISIIPFIVFVLIIAHNYVSINNRHKLSYTNKNFKLTNRKSSSSFSALYKREIRRYFGSTNYCLQTIIGPIISTVFLVIVYSSFKEVDFSLIGLDVGIILLLIIVFSLGLVPTTAVSISIEGKNFWILKTAPVSIKEVFYSKIGVNVLITVPFVILNSILSVVLFKLHLINALVIAIIGIIYALFSSVFGLFINVYNHTFTWTNETKLVKQSTSIMITTFSGMGLTLLIGIPSMIIMNVANSVMYVYLYILIFLLSMLIVFSSLLFKKGIKRFEKIEC